jgi:hypothetical protein
MVGARMVGRAPDSDSSLTTHKYAADYNATIVVDATYVNGRIAVELAENSLQTKTYVDQKDALRAQTADVIAADTAYVNASTLGVPNGIAQLDNDGDTLPGQLPGTLITDRIAVSVPGTLLLGSSSTHTCTTTVLREFRLATATIADPGYPWIPLPFATVTGYSLSNDPASRIVATTAVGQMAVIPPSGVSDTIYAAGVCAGVYNKPDIYVALPYGASLMTPITQPAVQGGLQLDLWASCLQSSNYVFSGAGLSYHVLVVPAM